MMVPESVLNHADPLIYIYGILIMELLAGLFTVGKATSKSNDQTQNHRTSLRSNLNINYQQKVGMVCMHIHRTELQQLRTV